jgi:hypothetical protein
VLLLLFSVAGRASAAPSTPAQEHSDGLTAVVAGGVITGLSFIATVVSTVFAFLEIESTYREAFTPPWICTAPLSLGVMLVSIGASMMHEGRVRGYRASVAPIVVSQGGGMAFSLRF